MPEGLAKSFWRPEDLGKPIPDSEHAVSVCLPLWEHNIQYEKENPDVLQRLQTGYPRFVLHAATRRFFQECTDRFAGRGECCLAFPSESSARRCVEFIQRDCGACATIHPVNVLNTFAVCLPRTARDSALVYWRHTGEIVSSRLAKAVLEDRVCPPDADIAKRKIRARVAELTGGREEDVYLFPTGMAATFAAFRMCQDLRPQRRSVQFGFPYVDLLRIHQRFGPPDSAAESSRGVCFFPVGDAEDIDEVERLVADQEVMGVFCEFPGNPLLRSPDLERLSQINRRDGTRRFPLVVDNTLGALINVDVLQVADVVVTSLTKFFSGAGDVMGGSLVLNPNKPFYDQFRTFLDYSYEETLYGEDAIVLEQNSRDCVDRVQTINRNARKLCEFLQKHSAIQRVYYPSCETPANYEAFLRSGGGYGGLLSLALNDAPRRAPAVFDALQIPKGPNLGTNFSLCCPFTILAHYRELDFAERCGVSRYLLRVSVGLEDSGEIIARFAEALKAVGGNW